MNVKGNPYPYRNTKIYNKDSEVVEGKASMSACLQNKTSYVEDWLPGPNAKAYSCLQVLV